MRALYEIDKDLMECVDAETGEIIDEAKMEALEMEREQKIENLGLWVKDLQAEENMIHEEEKKLKERREHVKNKKESVKSYLTSVLAGEKFKTGNLSISYRKSDSVAVLDLRAVPQDLLKVAEPTLDKAEAKKRLKAGEEIPGLELETKNNIQIR